MDALYPKGERRRPAAAILSVILIMGIGGAAPFAYMTVPIERSVDASPPSSSFQWFDASPMIYARSSPQVVELPDGDVLVIGGLTANGPTRTTEIYDPEGDSWVPGPNMNIARVGHTATLLKDGTVLITGGETGSGTTSTAEVMDLSKGASLYVNDMGFARSGHAAIPLSSGKVLVTGGTDWLSGVWKQAEAYVPSTHSFEPAGNMAYERLFLTLRPLPDGRVLAIGGEAVGTSEAYDPSTNSWGSVAQMSDKKYNAASVVLEDGDVLSAGGSADGSVLSSVEVYAADVGTWTPVSDMSTPRAGFGLVSMANGRVLATGSWSALGASETSESMCPCEYSWRVEAPMADARGMHGTATTADGTVLVIGGRDGSGPLSSVEMFVEVQEEPVPDPDQCEPMDLLPLVQAVADELKGYRENGLVAKLFVAQVAYDYGQLGLCLNVLDAFYNQVRAFYLSGHLCDDSTTMLYEGYAEVVECLGGEPLPPIP